MTQISVYGADHSLFQSLLNFLNFARGLYALTLNSEQTIETDHDSPTDFVLENCKSNCDHFIVNNMSCRIVFQFFGCLILLIDCWNSFWMVCFCSELIVVKLSLNTSWIMFNTRGMLQWFDSRSKVYSWECLTSKQKIQSSRV